MVFGPPLLGWTAILIVALIYAVDADLFGARFAPSGGNSDRRSAHTGIDVGARASSPLCCRARLPGFAAISGCRAMPSPMWMLSQPGSN